ncbi:MAG: DUF4058 family protein [Isosphaeraceae bacterium]
MHHLWTSELFRWVRPRLPAGYRAFIGSAPVLAIGAPMGSPDVAVQSWPDNPVAVPGPSSSEVPPESDDECAPDIEIAVATLDPNTAIWVEKQGRLIAAIELISPRNKDRPSSREMYLGRYLAYLLESVHLLLVDVHRRPIGFSFADRIAQDLSIDQAPLPTPLAVSYRVGEPAAMGGSYLAIWRRQLKVGASLPKLPLPLSVDCNVWVDLERTYSAAAVDAYLD